ncbi:MAG TPA: P27 family phage terminase small subunit [Pseudolabrys sp.]
MGARGRKSTAELSVIAVDGKPPRLEPPASLSEAERIIFTALVASCDARHFQASDLPLLVRYCEACALADLAAAELRRDGAVVKGKASPWIVIQEKAVRAMVALSMRLRLSPQSRTDPRTVGRRPTLIGPKAWEVRPAWLPGEENDDEAR